MRAFPEFKFSCPNCGSSKFHKRKGFHLLAKYRCHKCKSTFSKPAKIRLITAVTEHSLKSEGKSTIIYGKKHWWQK